MTWTEADQFLDVVKNLCNIVPLTLETHESARKLAQRHGLGFYDARIVAAASLAGCQILYTEDMHYGLVIEDGPTLQNHFV